MTERERYILKNIPFLIMEAKSRLEVYRYLMSASNRYEKEINDELDIINRLYQLEKELIKKKY